MSNRRIVNRKVTDDQIREALKLGTKPGARMLGITARTMQIRKRRLQERTGENMASPILSGNPGRATMARPVHGRIPWEIRNGVALVGSDWHIWPGAPSLMHRALLEFCRDMKPRAIVANGDVLDFCRISRHPPIGWEKQPDPQEEIEAAQDQLHEMEMASPRGCLLAWPFGNHDGRFETRLATVAPEFARVKGIHLHDHFPNWKTCWDVWINNDAVVTHRPAKGGQNNRHNNTLHSGKTSITGHLHSARVNTFTDYDGDRYEVDTGCIADPWGPQFNYLQNHSRNWRQAFCVLTFKDGRLLPPELVTQWSDDEVTFRGEIISV